MRASESPEPHSPFCGGVWAPLNERLTTRAATISLTNQLACEFARRDLGVRVNSINPGYFPSVRHWLLACATTPQRA